MSAQWNDQVASRRRGLSGRFTSLTKRWTPFSGRSATGPSLGTPGSNYDALQGFYRPDTPEAIMRKLADYAMMLRDFRLAQSTYDILSTDFKNDKALKYYAGASEMAAIATLLSFGPMSAKVRTDTVDQMLELAYYTYTTRSISQYHALRTLVLGAELLRMRGGSALDDAARWESKIIEDRLVGPTGHALTLERIATCYMSRQGVGSLQSGSRQRKAAFWNVLATDAWLRLDKPTQAEKRLVDATALYKVFDEEAEPLAFDGMNGFIGQLRQAIKARKASRNPHEGTREDDETTLVESMQEQSEQVDQRIRTHRKSLSSAAPPQALDPLGAVPLPSSPTLERPDPKQEGFE